MNFRKLSVTLAFLLVFFLGGFFFSNVSYAAEKIQLSFTTVFPQTHLHTVLNQMFADEIKKRTNGKVEITIYPVGTLTAPAKVYDAVVKGIADIGMSCPLWVAGRFPLSEIFEMPSDIPSSWVTTKTYKDLFDKFTFKEYEDVHILYLHGPGRNVITTKNTPINKPDDLKGLKFRTSGATVELVKAWGGVPRAMAMSEAYEALSKGVVDGNFAVPETLKGFKLAEPVKYLTIPPVSTSSCQFVAMNKKKWDSLPDDVKKVFTELSKVYAERQAYVWMYYDKVGLDYFKSLPGRQVIVIPKEKKGEWEKPAKVVFDKYIADKQAMGLPMKEYAKYFVERVAYHIERQPSEEQAVKWVETNLIKK
ncbi:MAG TPA: TRAP transporter substrate-binding protein [Syntrophorhabdaceae bacterium]|nr:TRAP transporter substrate-binding protein [Syntrophorhabdaceae bacterium]HPU29812.1 TRAP transporter substrate-binding protein [Syntrophorhabdaceae bacterium]